MLQPHEEGLLRAFQRRVRDLESCGLAKTKVTKLTVQLAGKSQGFAGFDPDQYRSFCVTLRQFLMQGDGNVNVGQACNIIDRRCPIPQLVAWSRHYREHWNHLLKTPMGVAVGDAVQTKNYSFEEALDLWFYAGNFHSNTDKEAKLAAMPHLAPDVLMMLVQARIPGVFELLRLLAEVVRLWLDAPSQAIPDPPPA
jgi:hypothetical protein